MRAEIIRKKMQKTVLKQGVQISILVTDSLFLFEPNENLAIKIEEKKSFITNSK